MKPSNAIAPQAAVQRWISSSAVWSRATAFLIASPVATYLVGGSIRDALRGVPGGDLDIAVDGAAIRLGRRLADELGGAYYVMDTDHDVGRVIMGCHDDRPHIDLAGLRGKTIADDLRARDLTINAMGMPLTSPLGELLDPTGGLADLRRGLIRYAYDRAFVDDPVRMLRAVRMSAGLGFALDKTTRDSILTQRPLLTRVSAERVRDELMLLLEQRPVSGLQLALDTGLLADVLAPVDGEKLRQGVLLLATLRNSIDALDALVCRLATTWSERFVPERSRRELISLAAVLAYGGPDAADAAVRGLRLASRESMHVRQTLRSWHDALWESGESISPLAAHRYYREHGAAGADAAALALVAPHTSGAAKAIAADLLAAWLDEHERVVAPVPMLRGHELIEKLGLCPGPVVGRLLQALVEAQVLGLVRDRDTAWAWLRDALDGEQIKGRQV
ncbi:MAG: tRNA nucleotidyltransferase/poly(A) polymerase family protein [Anaerolineae bacterium]